MKDNTVVMVRSFAESIAYIIVIFIWINLENPFSAGSVLAVVFSLFLLRSILISVAALFFH